MLRNATVADEGEDFAGADLVADRECHSPNRAQSIPSRNGLGTLTGYTSITAFNLRISGIVEVSPTIEDLSGFRFQIPS